MKHYREAGKALADFFENVEAKLRLLAGLEFVCAVAGAYCNGERIDPGSGNKFLHLRRVGVGSVGRGDVYRVLYAGKPAELTLDNDASCVRVVDYLLGESDVVLERMMAAVDHDGGESAVDAGFAKLKSVAVVEMHADGQPRILDGGFDKLHKVYVLCIVARAGGHLEDERSVLFHGGFGYALNYLHVVDVEGAYRITALIRFFEHFG